MTAVYLKQTAFLCFWIIVSIIASIASTRIFNPDFIQALDIHIGKKNHWENTYLLNTQYKLGPDGTYDIVLKENEYYFDQKIDLLIHFNQEKAAFEESSKSLWKEYLGNYTIERKDFNFDFENKVFGNSSGSFLKSKNALILRANSNSFFYRTQHTGSFTIEFWIYPSHLSENGIILERYGPVIQNGQVLKYSGIIAKFENQRLRWSLHNIFHTPDREKSIYPVNQKDQDITIQGSKKIKPNQWSHHALTYQALTGKLTYFINGHEQAFIFVTLSRQAKDTILIPRFYPQDKSLLKIGENFFGLIDELAITLLAKETKKKLLPSSLSLDKNLLYKKLYKKRKHFNIEKYISKKGWVTSHVYDLNQSNSYLQKIRMKSITKMGTHILVQYRMSPEFFTPDKSGTFLNWKTIDFQHLASLLNPKYSGQYFQWRAILIPSQNGKYSPILKDIHFQFEILENPSPPKMLKGLSVDGKLILTWQGNVESRVNRYRIYYGLETENYLEGNPPVEVTIHQLADKLKPVYELSDLPKEKIYYIIVTALDYQGHESEPSNEITLWFSK